MSKAMFPLEIKLPEDTVELLAVHGDDLISALVELAAQSKCALKILVPMHENIALRIDKFGLEN